MKRTTPFLLLAAALSAAALLVPPAFGAPYSKTMEITVPGVPSGVTLVDFPLLVRLSTDIENFSYSDFRSADGSDLHFELPDGTALPYDVDTWNTAGESLVWVKVPALTSATVVTSFWGSVAPDSNDPTAVWSNYVGVWHFNSTSNSASASGAYPASPIADSGTIFGVSGDETAHLGSSFKNTNTANKSRFKLGTTASNPLAALSSYPQFALSMWVKPTNTDSPSYRLFSTKNSYSENGFELLAISGSGTILRGDGSGNEFGWWTAGYQKLKTRSWTHQAFKVDGTAGTVFSDGTTKSGTLNGMTFNGANGIAVGGYAGGSNTANPIVGFVDEVRLYDGVPADEYLVAEYAQIATPGYVVCGAVGNFSSEAPFVAADAAVATDDGFTASGRVTQVGSVPPEVFLDWSADGGQTWSSVSLGTFSATGAVSQAVSGLVAGETYSWRFRAVGSETTTSDTLSVTLTGPPVLGAPSAALDGNAATMSVSLLSPGLSGTDDTTVELWFAAGDGALALTETFATATAAADFSGTVSNLAWGATFRYAFRATVPYGNGTLETWTETETFSLAGSLEWTAGAGTTDWHTSRNWNPSAVPSALLDVAFAAVGGDVTAAADGAAAVLRVDTTAEGTSFDFDGNALSADYLAVGTSVGGSRATLLDGEYSFTSNRVGWTNARQSTLVVGDGAVLSGNDIFVGTDNDLTASSNAVVFASGSATRLAGSLQLRAARGTRVDVEPGASLTVNRLEFVACNDRMVVDGGSFTNNGSTILFRSRERGELTETMFLELRNGADAKMNGNVYVNAGKNHDGAIYHAELRVLDGSVFDATGKDVLIDSNSSNSGPDSDHGSGAAIVVSNATFLAQALSIGAEDRHYGDEVRIYEDPGFETRVSASANCRVASSSWTRSGVFNHDHRILVEGGAFSVAGTLMVGDGGEYYAQHADNRVEIKRANARVSAGNLTVYGKSYLSFAIPSGGFDQVPFQVTGTASFAEIPTGAEAPVSEIRVDATGFTGRQTLLTAASVTGLTSDRVVVTARPRSTAKITVTETEVEVNIAPAATVLIVR